MKSLFLLLMALINVCCLIYFKLKADNISPNAKILIDTWQCLNNKVKKNNKLFIVNLCSENGGGKR